MQKDSVDTNNLLVPEEITKRKEITSMSCSFPLFHKNTYIPMLKQYRYHIALVSILSKNHCKKFRYESFKRNLNWFFSERDYAERLTKQLDGEIQSDHFGDNPTLSIEGCTIQYHKNVELHNESDDPNMLLFDLHSHFSDYSKQDASTTFEHMSSMFKLHSEIHGPLPKNSVFLDHTDGCAKQYRSGNALYLLNVLCLKFNMIIDRAIGAPGHGKSVIDGLNAVDKHYLKKVMCFSGANRSDDKTSRMKMYSIATESTLSFAEECARLCGQEDRKFGVLSTPAYHSRNQKLNERYYHVQDPKKVQYGNLSKRTKGWINIKSQKCDGIRHHYNFRADPALGHGFIAARRIPCMCEACVDQLKQKWKSNTDFYQQPRYLGDNQRCSLWKVLGSLNNWRLITLLDKDRESGTKASKVTRNVLRQALNDKTMAMMSVIEKDNYGAIATTDDSALAGYYIFIFRSTPYVLQTPITTNSERIPAGELVCAITWLNPVPHTSNLYSHGLKDDTSLDSVIRIQHVVEENVIYHQLSQKDSLHKQIRPMYKILISNNTIVIEEECHDRILEK